MSDDAPRQDPLPLPASGGELTAACISSGRAGRSDIRSAEAHTGTLCLLPGLTAMLTARPLGQQLQWGGALACGHPLLALLSQQKQEDLDGKRELTRLAHADPITAVAFAAATTLLSADDGGKLKIWALRPGLPTPLSLVSGPG